MSFPDKFQLNSEVPQFSSNPIYSFVDDSNINHSYFFDHRPSLLDIRDMSQKIVDTHKENLSAISERGRPRKTHSCLLTRKLVVGSLMPSLLMGGVNIEESDALYVLAMEMKVVKDSSRVPSELLMIYTTYFRPKVEYNSYVCAAAILSLLDLVQGRSMACMVG